MRDRWKVVVNVKGDYAPNYYARSAQDEANIPFGEAAQRTARHVADKQ